MVASIKHAMAAPLRAAAIVDIVLLTGETASRMLSMLTDGSI